MDDAEVGVLTHDGDELILGHTEGGAAVEKEGVGGAPLRIEGGEGQQRRLRCIAELRIEHHPLVNKVLKDPAAEHIR